jgi:hypothetical protein
VEFPQLNLLMTVGTGVKIEWLVTVEGEPKTATGGWTGLDRVGRVIFHDGLRHRVAEAMRTSLPTTIIHRTKKASLVTSLR